MAFTRKIAKRYLFAKRSNNIVTWISRIGVIGIAIGSAALVIVLSVFNGFTSLIESNIDANSPYYRIEPATGKTIQSCEDLVERLSSIEGVDYAEAVVEERVAANYDGTQGIVTLRGVPSASDFSVSADAARMLGINVRLLSKLDLYYPALTEKSTLHANLRRESGRPVAVANVGGTTVIAPVGRARKLLGWPDGTASYIDLYCEGLGGAVPSVEVIRRLLGENFAVRNREEQNAEIYKVMRSEKWAIYMILLFMVVIVALNIYSSLSMLIMEKKRDIFSLKAMGATGRSIRRIFFSEGMMMTLIGLVAGALVGLMVCWAQQRWGLIGMPGNGIVSSYPVKVKALDILLSLGGVTLIGAVVSRISVMSVDNS